LPAPRTRAAARRLRQDIDGHHAAARTAALAAARPLRDRARAIHLAAIAAERAREQALGDDHPARHPLQPGLFDRRALREAELAEAADANRETEHDRRRHALEQARILEERIELAGLLLIPARG
jgi:hypothetical protein